MKKLVLELDDLRVKMELITLKYSSQSERVCYLLGMNHPFQDVAKRVQMMDKTKTFSLEEVRQTLKLSEGGSKKKMDQLGKWG